MITYQRANVSPLLPSMMPLLILTYGLVPYTPVETKDNALDPTLYVLVVDAIVAPLTSDESYLPVA
jgi:hypothetical protein